MKLRRRDSPNCDCRPSGTAIDTIVLHYTGMQTAAAALDRLCDPAAGVSSHYVIEEDGTVWQLVDEAARAYHAGVSCWRGRTALNASSIGIEIVNPGHDWGYRAFPPAQMQAVAALCAGIQARHPIEPARVVAHSDIAPDRKRDPGERFDWRWLAEQGCGLWTTQTAPPRAPMDVLLAGIGYDVGAAARVAAFQRRFHPRRIDGVADTASWGRAQAVHDLFTGG